MLARLFFGRAKSRTLRNIPSKPNLLFLKTSAKRKREERAMARQIIMTTTATVIWLLQNLVISVLCSLPSPSSPSPPRARERERDERDERERETRETRERERREREGLERVIASSRNCLTNSSVCGRSWPRGTREREGGRRATDQWAMAIEWWVQVQIQGSFALYHRFLVKLVTLTTDTCPNLCCSIR